MNDPLLEAAYTIARSQYNEACHKACTKLQEQFPEAGFDPTHHAIERGMKLYLASDAIASKIWEGSIAYEKAEESLHNQFKDFPESTIDRAFSEAYRDAR